MLLQFLHRGGGAARFVGDVADFQYRRMDDATAFAGGFPGGPGGVGGAAGAFCHDGDGGGQFLDGGGDHCCRIALLVARFCNFAGRVAQGSGIVGSGAAAVLDFADQLAQTCLHVVDCCHQRVRGDLALAQCLAEVAVGDAAGGCDHGGELAPQTPEDIAADGEGENQEKCRATAADRDDPEGGFAEAAVGQLRGDAGAVAAGRGDRGEGFGQGCDQGGVGVADAGIDHLYVFGFAGFVACQDLVVKLVE